MSMRRAFDNYDPFTDQRIDPASSHDLYQHPHLPDRIHSAVLRAKRLTGHLSVGELKELALQLDRFCAHGTHDGIEEMRQLGRDYAPAGESDNLLAYLKGHRDEIPVEEWPKYFGALALTMAGCIVNLLWHQEPRDDPPAWLANVLEDTPSLQPQNAIPRHANEYAFEAVNIIGYAEGFRAQLYEQRHRAGSAEGGKKSNAAWEPAKEAYWLWAMILLPPNHGYKTQREAERAFLAYLRKQDPDTYRQVASEYAYRTLRSYLKARCKAESLPYPF